ncbi:MAG: Hpt domain-containing protein [Gammaproteobacteria bacterium]|nr:Hpt domain-containing protein [Gammaproteobacteria bacterium]
MCQNNSVVTTTFNSDADSDEIHKVIHEIKGISGVIGASQLYQLCDEFSSLPQQLKMIIKELQRVVKQAHHLCQR